MNESKSNETNKRRSGTVTDKALIEELTESVENYQATCEATLKGEQKIREARLSSANYVFTLPDEGNDIANWNPEQAKAMADQWNIVANEHSDQAARMNRQATALRRMNRTIIKVREKMNEG